MAKMKLNQKKEYFLCCMILFLLGPLSKVWNEQRSPIQDSLK